ncbi:BCCT family transporter [Mollicutes bacterium LVI A0039]|nr:BCCT family transporter [Mollicutes bacterium LVI A0039]
MKKNEKKTTRFHSRNFSKWGLEINVGAVSTALIIITGFILFTVFSGDNMYEGITEVRNNMIQVFSTPMVLLMLLSFILVFVISLSPLGKIRIGGDQETPKFRRFSWYSMLFGAGMGIGFMFWGVAEPLFHNDFTPIFTSDNSTYSAIATSIFHWGMFPWAIYALISMALAFYAFNLKLPLAPRSLLYPILKDKIYGITGDIIDGLAVVITLFSLASSLGFGALQVNAGFTYLFGIESAVSIQVLIIVVVTFFATLSLVTGLDKGVRILSELNIVLALILVTTLFILGNTSQILTTMVQSTILYLTNIFSVNADLLTVGEQTLSSVGYDWTAAWTIFYWAWWIGWTIFVGMFIAKISNGRTIRDFLLSVTIVPSIIAIVWFSTFGQAAINANNRSGGELFNIVSSDESLSLYALFANMNIASVFQIALTVLSIILVISFFVTSSDSGSMVVDGLTSGGAPVQSKVQKIFWASMEGGLAILLILIGGSNALDIIQMVLIIFAAPFSIFIYLILILLIVQLIRHYKFHKAKEIAATTTT